MHEWKHIEAELAKKLDPKHVQPAQKFGPKGDYLEAWFVISEANRIFGHDGWSYHVVDLPCVVAQPKKIGRDGKDGHEVTYRAKVRVEVLRDDGSVIVREDVGAGHGYDVSLGLAHESAAKEAVSDALKRALRTFGYPFGLALYDKTREHVGADLEPILNKIAEAKAREDLTVIWRAHKDLHNNHRFLAAMEKRAGEIKAGTGRAA
ncbi:MAG: hypothetical protein D6773_07825 [Alphaproteobacteria bacterium]|nr:MAG: hypothetical protein D6773_07825 [Alphaproteobacteria bacterium]